jgi:hypothetical protein
MGHFKALSGSRSSLIIAWEQKSIRSELRPHLTKVGGFMFPSFQCMLRLCPRLQVFFKKACNAYIHVLGYLVSSWCYIEREILGLAK